jgi:hypothetical protein
VVQNLAGAHVAPALFQTIAGKQAAKAANIEPSAPGFPGNPKGHAMRIYYSPALNVQE